MRSIRREDIGEFGVVLRGGLGNQLFQLCAALAISARLNREFRLDPLSLTRPLQFARQRRSFAIEDLVREDEVWSPYRSAIHRVGSIGRGFVRERDRLDDPLSRIGDDTRLVSGYFQRHSLVCEALPSLKPRLDSSGWFDAMYEAEGLPQIAVHIRCGDYLNQSARSYHGLCSPEYYRSALDRVASETSLNDVVVVSDDLRTARKLLDGVRIANEYKVTYVSNVRPSDDLRLLASSNGVVMSNSSFSWWGAYLAGLYSHATVVAPNPWYAVETNVEGTLLSPNWISMSREVIRD